MSESKLKTTLKQVLPRRHWDALRRIRRRTPHLAAPKVMSHLSRMKDAGLSPRLVVDVGAAQGDWTASCLRLFPEATYVLLEPLPDYRQELLELAGDPRAQYVPAAAGRVAGKLPLLVPDDRGGSSFLTDHGGGYFKRSVDVDVIRLDDLRLEEPVSLLKLDVQGYELEVLAGASRVLDETEVLIAECSLYPFQKGIPLIHEVVDYVVQRDFRIFDVGDEVRTGGGDLAQIDLVFVRSSSSLVTST